MPVSKSTAHLDKHRAEKKRASIEAVTRFLETWNDGDLTIAAVREATGLDDRTLRRPHLLPLIEAKAGRSFSQGSSGGDPRTVRSLQRKLDEALARIGRLEARVSARNETIAARDERIQELQRLIDLLSMTAREQVDGDDAVKPKVQKAVAGTPSRTKGSGSAR